MPDEQRDAVPVDRRQLFAGDNLCGALNRRIGRNNVRVRWHADFDDNIELEIRSALAHELRGEIIDVERDNVHRVEAHIFGLVQQREVPLCERFAE